MTAECLAPQPPVRTPMPDWRGQLSPDEERAVVDAPWFRGLPAELGQALLSVAGVRRVPSGRTMAAALGRAEAWFGIARGAVKLTSGTRTGRQVTFSLAGPGDWFGDVAVIDGESLTHDAQTCMNTTLLVVSKPDLLALLRRQPLLGIALARINCHRAQEMMAMFTDAVSLSHEQRLIGHLLSLAKRFGVPRADGVRIALQMSQQDLANLLGASRQRINALLKKLERQSLLRVESTGLVLLSPQGLEAAAA
jgi:CRP/FNR family cyclic AMP-dependent transcriptional regulator